jgi:cytochrome c biogenesis protein CcdA
MLIFLMERYVTLTLHGVLNDFKAALDVVPRFLSTVSIYLFIIFFFKKKKKNQKKKKKKTESLGVAGHPALSLSLPFSWLFCFKYNVVP